MRPCPCTGTAGPPEVSTARPTALAHAGSHTGPEQAVTDSQMVWQALAHLTPKQRAVVVLRYYEDLSEAEIAAVLQIAPGTVKSHAHTALLALSTHLPDGPHGSAHGRTDMNLEADLRAALADSAGGASRPAPNIDSLLARGERHRRRRAAGRLGGVAAVLSVALAATGLDRSGPRWPSNAHLPPARDRPEACHRSQPDVRPTLPDSTSEETNTLQPRADIASFTTVRPAPCTSTCPAPKSSGGAVRAGQRSSVSWARTRSCQPPKGWFWGRTRAVVGHPSHDLVAWVERVGPRAGQVVVVEASTGKRLATTELEHPLPSSVIITLGGRARRALRRTRRGGRTIRHCRRLVRAARRPVLDLAVGGR